MRYLILSDIHSNDEALAAVLSRVRRKRFDRVVVLGDFVGYGANPNQVIDRIRNIRKEKVVIRGNHDKVVCGLESGDLFNPVALKAARWTTEKLTPRNRRFLEALPLGPATVDGAFAICHGSPRDEDAYIFTDYDAYLNFRELEANVCFFGHSHIPCVFTLEPHGILVELVKAERVRYPLKKGDALPHQPGLDRTAAGPQRRGVLRDLRLDGPRRALRPRRLPGGEDARQDLQGGAAAHPRRSAARRSVGKRTADRRTADGPAAHL